MPNRPIFGAMNSAVSRWTNQYYPAIYEGTNPVEPERTPEEGYHSART